MIWWSSIGTTLQKANSSRACDWRLATWCEAIGFGIDVVNDGEFGKAMRRSVDFGAWWSYVYDRLAGFELSEEAAQEGPRRLDVRQQGAQRVR